MIQLHKVSKRYPHSGGSALTNLNLSIPRGTMTFVVGHSGAGKSTLLKLLAGIERPSAGTVDVADSRLNELRRREIFQFRRRIGVVFQGNHLLHDRSVAENVALPLQVCDIKPEDIERRVRAALDKVALDGYYEAMPQQLSAGEQQRVSIARAIVNRPELILADEPTGNLDHKLAQEIMRLFWELNQLGTTVIVATHDTHMVKLMEMPVLVLEKGQIAHSPYRENASA